ncbi:MAG: TNT domain-containing protein [Clostridiales bacterium]|nr:TNT domain-containing protein [Clostridiales bacterium]
MKMLVGNGEGGGISRYVPQSSPAPKPANRGRITNSQVKRKLANDYFTNWRREGEIYGFKQAAADTVNMFVNAYNNGKPMGEAKQPLIEVEHKTPALKSSKAEFQSGTTSGKMVFTATLYYASYGLNSLIKAYTRPVAAKEVSKAVQPYYPPNNGALGATERIYLMPGDQIDRFGKLGGRYFSPAGTPVEMRSLPSNADLSQYRAFEVVKPFEVESSTIAPAFNQIGLGTQYCSPVSAEILLNREIIKIIP